MRQDVVKSDSQQTMRLIVRPCVQERQKWAKWGEVEGLARGQHREGDMLQEAELRIQIATMQEELNFVIPPPTTKFEVDLSVDPKRLDPNANKAQPSGLQQLIDNYQNQQWLLIISNLVQFEYADTFKEIIQIKDNFRNWLAKELGILEGKATYYVNFLQNKRKPRIFSDDKSQAFHPLIQKVMLKFQDQSIAKQVHDRLQGKNYQNSVLCLELQEQKAR